LLRSPQYQNGQLYFIWSGWDSAASPNTQNLYIAHMSSPTAIDSARVLLHEPTDAGEAWQQSQLNGNLMSINEGPEILVNAGRTFLVYCARCLRVWRSRY
jgi:GH43 family beta-xylosidase